MIFTANLFSDPKYLAYSTSHTNKTTLHYSSYRHLRITCKNPNRNAVKLPSYLFIMKIVREVHSRPKHSRRSSIQWDIQEAKLSLGLPTVLPKIVEVTWPRPRPLLGEFFVRPLGIPHTKLHTKFEVSNSSSFRDIAL